MKTIIATIIMLLSICNSHAEQAIGVNTHGSFGHPIEVISDMGATWARISMPWWVIEPNQGDYEFGHTDLMLRDIKARGLKVLFMLGAPPPFWSSNGEGNGIPHRNGWVRYVETISQRYGDYVDAWEIHNEPNLKEFFIGTSRDYIESYLKPASQILRKNTPATPIAAPGVTHISQAKPGEFLKDMKRYNALSYFDIVSYHVYTASKPKDFRDRLTRSGIGRPSVLKNITDAGMAGKKVFITEYGCDEAETRSETANATCLFEMTKILQSITWINGFFIYSLHDDPRYHEQFRWGLLRHDLTIKPAINRLKPLFRRMN